MPFTAQIAGTERRVSLLDPADADIIGNPHSSFACKACATEMRIRKGVFGVIEVVRRTHFFHMPQASGERECAMLAYSTNEGHDHRRVKAMFANDLAGFIPVLKLDPPTLVEMERWLPECGRIADVYFETRGGYRAAIEIQLSPLPCELLERRSRDYLDADITPIWAFVDGQITDTEQRVLDRLGLDRLLLGLVRTREQVRA